MIDRGGTDRYRVFGFDFNFNLRMIYSSIIICQTFIFFISLFIFYSILRFPAVISTALSVIIILPINYIIQEYLWDLFSKTKYDFNQTLFEISQSVTILTSVDRLLKFIVRLIVRKLRLSGAAILIYEQNKEKYSVKAAEGTNASLFNSTFSTNFSLIEYLKTNKTPVDAKTIEKQLKSKTLDIKEKTFYGGIKSDLIQLKSELAVPILWQDELIGILCLGSKISGDKFDDDDIYLLTILSNQEALAIKNATFYSNLNKISNQLNSLITAKEGLSKIADLDIKSKKIVELLKESLDFVNDCSIYIFDDKNSSLMLTASTNPTDQVVKQDTKQLLETAFREKRILASHEWGLQNFDAAYKSKIVFPLIADKKNIGVLAIFTKEKHDYSKDEIEMLSIFVRQVANLL